MPSDNNRLVSVVIPCFNGERFVAEAVDSALGQTYRPVEVIVVDDGSTDGSPSVIRSYGSRIRVVTQNNAGLPAARNAGIRASHGKYCAFLDADDYWHPVFLERMIAALEASHAGIAYCGWQNVGLPGPRGEPFVPPDYENEAKLEAMFGGVRWPVHAAVVRRDVVDSVGGFDPQRKSCEDFAFWIRAATNYKLARVPHVLAYYRHHGEAQMTKNREKIAINHWQVQEEFLRENPKVVNALGKDKIAELTLGKLLDRGYECYWNRDLTAARNIFRLVMKHGYGSLKDWKYMLPSLLPLSWHQALINLAAH